MLTMQEAVHASMYALVKEKGSEAWQYSYAKVWRVPYGGFQDRPQRIPLITFWQL